MGFFSDLKEDLSQAVNELMPEETLDAAMTDGLETEQVLPEEEFVQETPVTEEAQDTVSSLDISSMLDRLDEVEAPQEMSEETEEFTEEQVEEDILGVVEQAETAIQEEEPELPVEEDVLESDAEEMLPAEEYEEPADVEEAVEETVTESEMETMDVTDAMLSQTEGEEEDTMDMQTANRVAVDETAVVTEGMTITGDIVSQGSMELIGTVNGNLDIYGKLNITGTIQGNSKAAEIYAEGAKIAGEVNSDGSVKIGQSSVVIGNISASSAVIAGAVKGDIDVHGPVILDTTAIVMGNIKSKSVQINNGAVIEGLCSQCYADINPSTFFEEFKKRK